MLCHTEVGKETKQLEVRTVEYVMSTSISQWSLVEHSLKMSHFSSWKFVETALPASLLSSRTQWLGLEYGSGDGVCTPGSAWAPRWSPPLHCILAKPQHTHKPMCCVLTPGLIGSASLCKQQHCGTLFPPYCLSSPTALPTCLVWSIFLLYPGYPNTLSTTSLLEQHPLLLGWLQEIKFSVTCLQSQEKCMQMQTYNWKLPWPLPSPKEYPSPQETFFILTGNKFL